MDQPITEDQSLPESRKYYKVTIRVEDPETGEGEEMEVYRSEFKIEEDTSVDLKDMNDLVVRQVPTPPKLLIRLRPQADMTVGGKYFSIRQLQRGE